MSHCTVTSQRPCFAALKQRCGSPSRKCDQQRAKYELALSIRTHIGSDDAAHTCIQDAVDKEGLPGIRINKSVVPSATEALKLALEVLGPEVLPVTEMVSCKCWQSLRKARTALNQLSIWYRHCRIHRKEDQGSVHSALISQTIGSGA